MRRVSFHLIALAAATAAASACSDSGNGPNADANLGFNLATRPAVAPVAAAGAGLSLSLAASESFTDGSNTLVIDQVQLVLAEIELKRIDHDVACGTVAENVACEQLEIGPVLLDLPLGAGVTRQFAVPLAAGTYDEIDFEIHRPEDGAAGDAAFLQAHPEFAQTSIRVTGTYNGTPFTFTNDLGIEQEIQLAPPFEVVESASTDLTMRVDLDGWFRTGDGTLVDPASANEGGPNKSLVEENVKISLHAFEDHDRDGSVD